jgi:hypothetical protein
MYYVCSIMSGNTTDISFALKLSGHFFSILSKQGVSQGLFLALGLAVIPTVALGS